MWAIAKGSVWQAEHTAAIGEVTKVAAAPALLGVVGTPLASTAKAVPKVAVGVAVNIAVSSGDIAKFTGPMLPAATVLYWRLFGDGMTDPGALKSNVPGRWQLSQFLRMPGYPIL
jgi:hypothetical protein